VLESEREVGQQFSVDIELFLDLSIAAATDDLTKTVDYSAVAAEVHALLVGQPFALIETLAERIAETCLVHTRINQVCVSVHKPQAPIAVPFEDVSVTLCRGRADV
jgi:dihydroneopterin aldolase